MTARAAYVADLEPLYGSAADVAAAWTRHVAQVGRRAGTDVSECGVDR